MSDYREQRKAAWEQAGGDAVLLRYIESPHNACMHKEHCLSLKADLAAANARVAELDWLLDCAKKTGITVTYRDGVMSVIHGAFHDALESAEARLATAQSENAELADRLQDKRDELKTAEADALRRAGEAIQGRISAHPLGSTAMVEAHKCKAVVLALIPKEAK